jgi:CIC family chloride channel protein
VLGLVAAGIGIVIMLGVTWLERGFRRRATAVWLRPALGGLAVALVAFFFPQVLGSGHGAIQEVVNNHFAPRLLLLLLLAKALASALSVGSGFRGGLFSSSLFIGSLFGGAMGGALASVLPGLAVDQLAYTLVGMGAMAAAIVGAPVTMILLILEATASFYVAIGVTVGVIVASIVVRLTFGYSFATWRFHLRGVPIYGATDIGWIRDLTADKLMRRDVHAAPETLSIAEFRRQFPLGGPTRVFLLDGAGGYRGMLATADAYNPDLDERANETMAGDLKQGETRFLLPRDDVRTALELFAEAQLDVLPVVASAADRKVVGFVTEAYALRRYNQELERSRAQELGQGTLFGRS